MSDNNLVSISGKPDGELWLVDFRNPEGHTNTLIRPKGDTSWVTIDLGRVFALGDTSDAIKVSGAYNAVILAEIAVGGSEDVIDINHSHDIVVKIDDAKPQGRYLATIKGGSKNIKIHVERQVGHGKYEDFDLGNWSNQNNDKVRNVEICSNAGDGTAIKIRCLNAEKPKLTCFGNYRLTQYPSCLFVGAMKIAKFLHIK